MPRLASSSAHLKPVPYGAGSDALPVQSITQAASPAGNSLSRVGALAFSDPQVAVSRAKVIGGQLKNRYRMVFKGCIFLVGRLDERIALLKMIED